MKLRNGIKVCIAMVLSIGLVSPAMGQSMGVPGGVPAVTKAPITPKPYALTDAQRAEVQARFVAANVLLTRLEPDAAANNFASGWRTDVMNMLLSMSSHEIKALAGDSGWKALGEFGVAVKAIKDSSRQVSAKLLGDTANDLVYYPITPCRNVDTRATSPILGGTAKLFDANFAASQGGTAGCGVVAGTDASAWAMNITVINMTTTGFVAVRSVSSTNTTSTANYTGPGQQVNNFVIVFNNRTSSSEWEVYAATTVDVIIDLFGYFLPPSATALDCITVTNSAAGTGLLSAGASCPAGYTLTGGACGFLAANTNYLNEVGFPFAGPGGVTPSTWLCAGNNPSTTTLYANAYCCRVPGR